MRIAIVVGVVALAACGRETRISYKNAPHDENGIPKAAPSATVAPPAALSAPRAACQQCQDPHNWRMCVNDWNDPRPCCEGKFGDDICRGGIK